MSCCLVASCDRPKYVRGWCSMHYQRWLSHGDPEPPSLIPHAPKGATEAWVRWAAATQTDECLLWPFAVHATGYGAICWEAVMTYPHRIVLILSVGHPKVGQEAAHTPGVCHNRLCCNPRHLRWATRAENIADKLIDGTHNRGEKHPLSKLKEFEVLAIRSDGRSQRAIAADYGIGQRTVGDIKLRRRWAWLEDVA